MSHAETLDVLQQLETGGPPHRPVRALVLLVPALLLAGCTQLDEGKAKLAEAQQNLDEAKREAQEAKDRFDRVKSATIVRTERVDLLVQAVRNETSLTFNVMAVREGYTIPAANLTSVQAIVIQWPGAGESITCDPLTCRIGTSEPALTWGWADETARVPLTQALSKARGTAGVTTAAGDVTG